VTIACALVGCASAPPQIDLTPLRTKAEAGDPVAMFSLAIKYDAGREVPLNREEAARWYLRSAEAGFPEAQNSIGSMYQAGDGVERNLKKARIWYEKAASQGHLEGAHNLAYLYDEGLGVSQDNGRAIELYTKAADSGFVKSMLNLGIMHRHGDGVPVNQIEGYKWLDLARFYTQNSKDMQLKWRVRGQLDDLRKQMSPADISAAEKLTAEWDRIHRKSQ
jgi:TPR repeat protein